MKNVKSALKKIMLGKGKGMMKRMCVSNREAVTEVERGRGQRLWELRSQRKFSASVECD